MDREAYIEMAAAEQAHWWFQGRRAILSAVIERLNLPSAARILELGSGTGGNFEMLSQFGTVTAVEANALARSLAAQTLGRRNGAEPVEMLPGLLPYGLPDLAPFDLIALFDVLEHIDGDEDTLQIVKRLLAPGGVLVITVPAYARLWGPHDEQHHHKRRYERVELEAKLLRAGFKIAKLSYSNMFLFPAALALRVADRLRQLFLKSRKASGTGVLPYPINRSFTAIFAAERLLMERTNLPFGLSLLAVAKANPATAH